MSKDLMQELKDAEARVSDTPTPAPAPMTAERLAEIARAITPYPGKELFAYIDALTARVAELEQVLALAQAAANSAANRAQKAEAELAAARKVENVEIAWLVEWLSAPLFEGEDAPPEHQKAADAICKLSAALKEAEEKFQCELRRANDYQDNLERVGNHAKDYYAQLETLRKVFAPVFKDFGPEWPDGEGLEVVLSQPDDEDGEEGVGACHFTLGQLRRALQTKDTP